MLKALDSWLNRITMYRLVLYYLIGLLATAALLSATGVLNYNVFALLFSTGFLLIVCLAVNWVFARTFGVAANVESVYISALILALIITPVQSPSDVWFLGWAAVMAMASKYILAVNRKHLFNPVALAVAVTYFTLNQSASWWVGNAYLLPFVIIGGLLVMRKLERSHQVLRFLAAAVAVSLVGSLLTSTNPLSTLQKLSLYSPLFFFAFIILTEPMTTPPTRNMRIGYGALVGLLFSPQVHVGSFFITPEVAILIGNVFSFLVSQKSRVVLRLKEKNRIAPDIYDFIFTRGGHFGFVPGQYMEWTLGHNRPDGRGNRRFFTLASSPTEKNLRLGVRIDGSSSSFKKALLEMKTGDEIIAGQLGGDFILPSDAHQKVVLIAGGVGVTPFRSMIKYLLDIHRPRPLVLFYASKSINDIVYKDVFDRAQHELGIQVIYTVTDAANLPSYWNGVAGRITPELIREKVPDYKSCLFYISGPRSMVDSFKETLTSMDIPSSQVRIDYFAGLS